MANYWSNNTAIWSHCSANHRWTSIDRLFIDPSCLPLMAHQKECTIPFWKWCRYETMGYLWGYRAVPMSNVLFWILLTVQKIGQWTDWQPIPIWNLLYLIIDVYLDVYVLPKQHCYKVYVIGHCAVVFVRRPQLI